MGPKFPLPGEPKDIAFIPLKPKPGSHPRVSPEARDAVKSGPVLWAAMFSLFSTILSFFAALVSLRNTN